MRFHLIDRIDVLEAHRAVTARKLTSHQEDFWRDEGRGPEMPAPLVLEALCQAGTWLIMGSTGLRRRAALLSADSVSFQGAVRPGDVLVMSGRVESFGDDTAVLSGTVTAGGHTVLSADAIMCALIPTEDLEDPQDVRRMYDRLTRGARITGGALKEAAA
ncbi:hotdog domain-containing protein [Streptomyces sp. ME19-01-6]|uniref:hotdog domain-containing protein n=1 Tax=Streptomyces sp. ME19-01-6 TaxID=3028686 RepID=UPI0029AB3C41|nr:hotdog domain-containing protein [Streptomyces sp. ME19-01-6]MDX3232462.1 hotdog domain-containing protein [Streptomyces sp. ME19-01-6]